MSTNERKISQLKGKKRLAWIVPKRVRIRKEISRVVAATTMY